MFIPKAGPNTALEPTTQNCGAAELGSLRRQG